MGQKYDMSTPGGSGMNIALEKMQEKAASELDVEMGSEGIDSHLL